MLIIFFDIPIDFRLHIFPDEAWVVRSTGFAVWRTYGRCALKCSLLSWHRSYGRLTERVKSDTFYDGIVSRHIFGQTNSGWWHTGHRAAQCFPKIRFHIHKMCTVFVFMAVIAQYLELALLLVASNADVSAIWRPWLALFPTRVPGASCCQPHEVHAVIRAPQQQRRMISAARSYQVH